MRVNRRSLMIASVALIVSFVFCGAVSAAGYIVLRRAAVVQASSPEIAIDRYLHAIYSKRDVGSAKPYVCRDKSIEQKGRQALDELQRIEERFHTKATISWGSPATSFKNSGSATGVIKINYDYATGTTYREVATFELQKAKGWRVCDFRYETEKT